MIHRGTSHLQGSIRLFYLYILYVRHSEDWFILTSLLDVYMDLYKLESVLEPFDPNSLLYYSSGEDTPSTPQAQGVCDKGHVEILSKELVDSFCSAYSRCNVSVDEDKTDQEKLKCVEPIVTSVCSVTPPLQVCTCTCI